MKLYGSLDKRLHFTESIPVKLPICFDLILSKLQICLVGIKLITEKFGKDILDEPVAGGVCSGRRDR
jgi:hypothetical protein